MTTQRPVRLVVAGGGTLGHVFPVIAVVDALRTKLAASGRALDVLFVGRHASPEESIVRQAGLAYTGITAGKLRRYIDLQNLIDPVRVVLGFFQSVALCLKFRPDVVFTKGGYVSVPILAAAWLLEIPIVAHETDAVLGISNRLAARIADRLCTAYTPSSYRHQRVTSQLVYTGNPVRAEFFGLHRPPKSKGPYTVLAMGGSQGAASINHAVRALIERPLANVALIHVTGPAHYAAFTGYASTSYHPLGFAEHLPDLVGQADLVISRAGGSVFELAAAGRPTILVPLSTSANRHQELNAHYFGSRKAAVVLDEAALTGDRLRALVRELLASPSKRRRLSDRIRSLAVVDAADRVAREIVRVLEAAAERRYGA